MPTKQIRFVDRLPSISGWARSNHVIHLSLDKERLKLIFKCIAFKTVAIIASLNCTMLHRISQPDILLNLVAVPSLTMNEPRLKYSSLTLIGLFLEWRIRRLHYQLWKCLPVKVLIAKWVLAYPIIIQKLKRPLPGLSVRKLYFTQSLETSSYAHSNARKKRTILRVSLDTSKKHIINIGRIAWTTLIMTRQPP
jgi:hypothetical protein